MRTISTSSIFIHLHFTRWPPSQLCMIISPSSCITVIITKMSDIAIILVSVLVAIHLPIIGHDQT